MKARKDSKESTAQFYLYAKNMSKVYKSLVDYLDVSNDFEEKKNQIFDNLMNNLEQAHIKSNKSNLHQFLRTILLLSLEHQPTKFLDQRIENILVHLKPDLKIIFSEKEIFSIFYKSYNPTNLLILIEHGILHIETLIENLSFIGTDQYTIKYFYPEIRENNQQYFNEIMTNFKIKNFENFVEENDKNLEVFYSNRKEGECHMPLKKLIREDNIKDFIFYVENSNYNINAEMCFNSIFERRMRLRESYLRPIEYAALFGSLQIFKYLLLKGAEINPKEKIIECTIQGRSYDIMHILEENKSILCELKNPARHTVYLRKSIACHHNEFLEYFMKEYAYDYKIEKDINRVVDTNNFQLLHQFLKANQIDLNNPNFLNELFFWECECTNEEAVKILISLPSLNVEYFNEILKYILFCFNKKKLIIV